MLLHLLRQVLDDWSTPEKVKDRIYIQRCGFNHTLQNNNNKNHELMFNWRLERNIDKRRWIMFHNPLASVLTTSYAGDCGGQH